MGSGGLPEDAAVSPERDAERCLPLPSEGLTRQTFFDAGPKVGAERIDTVDDCAGLWRLRRRC